jgi:hypothetical protein
MSAITIIMDADDADRLAHTSMAWGADWAAQDGRFEIVKGETSYAWSQAYWLEDGTAALILFTSYLSAHGHDHAVLWDLAADPGYVVVTDWKVSA